VNQARAQDWKGVDNSVVEAGLAAVNPTFTTAPYAHQKAGFLAGMQFPRMMFLMEMGSGKTKIVLDLLSHQIATGALERRSLILVPNDANVASWQREVAVHTPHLTCAKQSLDKVIPAARLVICTYPRLTALLTNRRQVGKSTKRKRVIDRERVERFAAQFDAVVFDESTAIQNSNSLITKLSVAISWRCKTAYGLTGTPFGRDPQALFSQFLAVDEGETFGRSITRFREEYFRQVNRFWGGFEWRLRAGAKAELRERIRHRSLHYDLDECVTLPDLVESRITVRMSDEAAEKYYDLRELLSERAQEGEDARVGFIRMRQIATGLLVEESEFGERVEKPFDSNPKLDALQQLMEEIPPDKKVVIFHEFNYSGHAIAEVAKKFGGVARLYGGTDDKEAELAKFVDGDCRTIVCNSKSGAMGLNLQVANYMIFYECPVSPIVREQAKARCRRTGQTSTVVCYDICAENTVEEKILRWVEEGKDLLQAVVAGRERL